MCGIVACTGLWQRWELEDLLERASQRGPHGWGVAINTDGGLDRWVGVGRYTKRVLPPLLPDTGALVAHARLATSADRDNRRALQPIVVAGYALVHNGTVPDAAAWNVPWPTGNDSEVLLQWLLQLTGPWARRLQALAGRLTTPYALALLEHRHVWLMRRGHPLFITLDRACSRPFNGAQAFGAEDLPVQM